MKIKTEQFVEVANHELKNDRTRIFLSLFPPAISAMRQRTMATFIDPAAAHEYGIAIRTDVISRLPELLEQFEKNAIDKGSKIIWARDAKEANEAILKIAKERNIKYVTKGKSMVSEEINLNETLIENGIDAFETDLGEFIAQQLDRPPFHIVGPAINIPVEEVCDLFMKKADMKEPTLDPVELGYAARLFLRDKFHNLEMGITGINMAVAETGTIINVENEGNIRLSKSSPKTQVSIMSLEKVVPSMMDAIFMLRLLCKNCTGQKISSYVSMDSGPKKPDEIDGPEELFIVIIDNGRADTYSDIQAREAFRCIRCGACLAICPVYCKIGGYPYGWAYSGPMGQVLNPLLLGLKKTQDLYRACTYCGACRDVCPGGIDHPKMFRFYRSKDVEHEHRFRGKRRPLMEQLFFAVWSTGTNHAWIWNTGAKMARPFINMIINNDLFRKMIRPLDNWLKIRDFPLMPGKTFHKRWKEKNKQIKND